MGIRCCARRCCARSGVIHRREQLTPRSSKASSRRPRAEVLQGATTNVPSSHHSSQSGEAVRDAWRELFPLHHGPGSGADQHPAEQAIRFVVIDRLITQGHGVKKENRWCERSDRDRDARNKAIGVCVPGSGRRGVVRRTPNRRCYCLN